MAAEMALEGVDINSVYLLCQLKDKQGLLLNKSTRFLCEYKELDLPRAKLRVDKVRYPEGIEFRLSTDMFAHCVWIVGDGDGEADDNFFDLQANESRAVFYKTSSSKEKLEVYCLNGKDLH